MDILDRLLEHDAEATRRLLGLCRDLSDEQWHRSFEFGQGSLYATFDHMIDSMEYWTTLMRGLTWSTPADPSKPIPCLESLTRRFEAASPDFIAVSRQIREEGRFDETFVDIETGPVRRTFGSCIVHVTTHSMHHRAQVRIMFDLLGVAYDPFGGFAMDEHPLVESSDDGRAIGYALRSFNIVSTFPVVSVSPSRGKIVSTQ